MIPVPDRRKLRRDYIAGKSTAYVAAAVCTALFLPAVLLTIVCGAGALMLLGSLLLHLSTTADLAGLTFVALAGVSGFSAGLAWIFWHGIREAGQEARQLQYVPPVDTANLPAAEVLVRGTRLPAEPDGELLRVATAQPDVSSEQLLRVIP